MVIQKLKVSTVLLLFPAVLLFPPELLYGLINSPQTSQIQYSPILEEPSIGQCAEVIP